MPATHEPQLRHAAQGMENFWTASQYRHVYRDDVWFGPSPTPILLARRFFYN